MILIMSFPILLWSLKLIPDLFVGFWRLWLFNYPFSFTLDFTTLNRMDWYETCGIPSISVFIPYFQDFSPMDKQETIRMQKELSLNYDLGRFLLYTGFSGLISSAILLISNKIKVIKKQPTSERVERSLKGGLARRLPKSKW